MAAKTVRAKKVEVLTWKKGWMIFAICWVATFAAVTLLRHLLIPKEELDCYARIEMFQKAVDKWNAMHPDQAMTDSLDKAKFFDENKLTQVGLIPPQTYDHNRHYYFIGATAHGLKVQCNKDADNPLILKLTGDSLLAMLAFVVFCSSRGLVFFGPE